MGDGLVGFWCVDVVVCLVGLIDVVVKIYLVVLNYCDLMFVCGDYLGIGKEVLIFVVDGVGEVVEIGCDVMCFKLGDCVINIYFLCWIDGLLML